MSECGATTSRIVGLDALNEQKMLFENMAVLLKYGIYAGEYAFNVYQSKELVKECIKQIEEAINAAKAREGSSSEQVTK